MIRSSQAPSHGTRDQREGGGVTSRSRGCSVAAGCNHGDGAGRVVRATAAMRIAATGKTMAVGAGAVSSFRTERRLA
jgi:hypothetical protein